MQPLVSVGIPTYNRARQLKRALESVVSQDYSSIEIIVSDNDSTDETPQVCEKFRREGYPLNYIRQQENIGPTKNFSAVLMQASGQYFMWLGDDDWIDPNYISTCIAELSADANLVSISGTPRYYENGMIKRDGQVFDLPHESWWARLIVYYAKVTDNGMFYGVTRTQEMQSIEAPNTIGSDWLLIAALASLGKTKVNSRIVVHRNLGGATVSYRRITESLGLPKIQSIFPKTSTALSAWAHIVFTGVVYQTHILPTRIVVGTAAFTVIFFRPFASYLYRKSRKITRRFSARTG